MSLTVTAIDPGPELSAYCTLVDGTPFDFAKLPNAELLERLPRLPGELVVEMIASYGMGVGAEVFETCVWIGRLTERALPRRLDRRTRLVVKTHLCHSARATDSNVRHALLDRFGGMQAAQGTRKAPGPLFGLSGDCWAALALGMLYYDTLKS